MRDGGVVVQAVAAGLLMFVGAAAAAMRNDGGGAVCPWGRAQIVSEVARSMTRIGDLGRARKICVGIWDAENNEYRDLPAGRLGIKEELPGGRTIATSPCMRRVKGERYSGELVWLGIRLVAGRECDADYCGQVAITGLDQALVVMCPVHCTASGVVVGNPRFFARE